VTVVKMQREQTKPHIKNTLDKLSIRLLLSKNENRDTLAFKIRKESHKKDNSSSKKHIIITQKQTKKEKPTHKLHSPHRSYNKA